MYGWITMETSNEFTFGKLGEEIRNAIARDLDAKIIITSHNSKPGLGKTTLATRMARAWDKHGWSAEEKAFMDVFSYHEAYLNENPGSVLLFDEIEGEADNRRSNSNKNVQLSQAWAQQRFRNMVTICTLPTVSMLDSRMLELSDYWINVMRRGVAHPYRVLVNDFTGEVVRSRMGVEGNAVIKWEDLPDTDSDYSLLTDMKAKSAEFERTYYSQEEVDEKIDKALESNRKDWRDNVIHELYTETDMSQSDISDFDFVGVSQPQVQRILSE